MNFDDLEKRLQGHVIEGMSRSARTFTLHLDGQSYVEFCADAEGGDFGIVAYLDIEMNGETFEP